MLYAQQKDEDEGGKITSAFPSKHIQVKPVLCLDLVELFDLGKIKSRKKVMGDKRQHLTWPSAKCRQD